MVNVLFVCLGNICRSPAAEGVFRALVAAEGLADAVTCDSAGTHNWHAGKPPDPRAIAAGRRRGIDLSELRARWIAPADFRRFDLVLAMDRDNLADLAANCPKRARHRLGLFLKFAPEAGLVSVPDPYYDGDEAFERMFDLIEAGARGLCDQLRRQVS